jgi:copper-exporting ATPase
MKTIILSIEGMSCSACSNGIEKYLNKQNGIFDAKVNLVMANATITYDEKILDIPKIEKYIEKSGYKSLGLFKNFNIEKKKKNEKLLFIIFSILAIILMYISMGHMINLPLPKILEPHKSSKIYSTTLLILTIPFLIYGFDILKSGYNNLIHKMPNMDTLVSIGVITGLIYSIYNMYHIFFNNNHHLVMNLYFESSAIIIYFVKLRKIY